MTASPFARCARGRCGLHIEFPIGSPGAFNDCPHCAHRTELTPDAQEVESPPRSAEPKPSPTPSRIVAPFSRISEIGLGITGHWPDGTGTVACAAQRNFGVRVRLDGPASGLSSNFATVSKQISLLHYAGGLSIAVGFARFVPAKQEPAPAPEPLLETAEAAALEESRETPGAAPRGLKLKPR